MLSLELNVQHLLYRRQWIRQTQSSGDGLGFILGYSFFWLGGIFPLLNLFRWWRAKKGNFS